MAQYVTHIIRVLKNIELRQYIKRSYHGGDYREAEKRVDRWSLARVALKQLKNEAQKATTTILP